MDGGAWWAAVHGVAKSQTRLSDFPFTFHFHALGKEMATHSSVLAWRIPGTGEPGGLPSMGSESWTRLKRLSSSSRSRCGTVMAKPSPKTVRPAHHFCLAANLIVCMGKTVDPTDRACARNHPEHITTSL